MKNKRTVLSAAVAAIVATIGTVNVSALTYAHADSNSAHAMASGSQIGISVELIAIHPKVRTS